MTQNIGSSWKVIFTPSDENNDLLSTFLEEYFEVLCIDYIENGQEQYTACSSTQPDSVKLVEAAASWGITLPEYKVEFVPAANWLTKNVIKFAPIETKDFLIYGSHEENIPDLKNKIPLKIYAATAFGSGQHQTTRSCLELISDLHQNRLNLDNLLDMGCGSGILALSALKLWNTARAQAADIDDEAVIVALQNASDNQLSERLNVFQSNGFENKQIIANGPYDLILANILARPLIEMSSYLAQNLKKNGHAIISGFTEDQVDWVIPSYEEQGFKLIKVHADQNWRAALLEQTK